MTKSEVTELKQFILSTVTATEERLESRLGKQLHDVRIEVALLRHDMYDGFAAIAESISSLHDIIDNHEGRLIKLEKRTAR
jgi:hypothetical protein